MRDPKKHITYSLTDIEQYLQGKLSPAEMHELEKAALQDPFLADAIEGYESADLKEAKKNLAEIETRLLQEEQEEIKPIPVILSQNKWWKVAAAILLFAGAGTIGWLVLNNNPGTKEIAQQNIALDKTDAVVQKQVMAKVQQKPVIAEKQKELSKSQAEAATIKENAIRQNKQAELTAYENSLAKKTLSEKEAMTAMAVKPTLSPQRDQVYSYTTGTLAAGALSVSGSPMASNHITALGNTSSLTVSGNASFGTSIGSNTRIPMNTFKGNVFDAKTLQPISNATIILPKNRQGIVTDAAGNFVFSSYDTVLPVRINSLGFEEKDIMVSANKPNPVMMHVSNTSLEEVVVVGYGTKKRKEVSGSVSTVNPETLKDISPALRGKAAGVEVAQNKPIQIRGSRSLSGNNPLYIMDGIPVSNINDINPNAIESIQVLKDSAAASIYGVNSNNGVVVITTTKARKNRVGSIDAKTLAYTDMAVPQEGWTSMLKYLKKKINIAKEYNTVSIQHGAITVTLTLKDNKVLDVEILKTFNDSISPTLIQALKDGPGWTSSILPGETGKRTVIIVL